MLFFSLSLVCDLLLQDENEEVYVCGVYVCGGIMDGLHVLFSGSPKAISGLWRVPLPLSVLWTFGHLV